MSITYEWIVETVTVFEDPCNDILDVSHFDNFKSALAFASQTPPEGCRFAIGLVRDKDDSPRFHRSWAYLNNYTKLPEFFEDAHFRQISKVPVRFHNEIKK